MFSALMVVIAVALIALAGIVLLRPVERWGLRPIQSSEPDVLPVKRFRVETEREDPVNSIRAPHQRNSVGNLTLLEEVDRWLVFAYWRVGASLEFMDSGLEEFKAQTILSCAITMLLCAVVFGIGALLGCDMVRDPPYLEGAVILVMSLGATWTLPERFTRYKPSFATYTVRARALGTVVVFAVFIGTFALALYAAGQAREYNNVACRPLWP